MCYSAILPTISNSSALDENVMTVTYIFNRWLKMLYRYGQLDPTSINTDFSTISKVIRGENVKKSIKKAVAKCRDYALADTVPTENLITSLKSALELLCESQEDKSIKKVKQCYADQGMTERYRPLSKRLAREKIRKIGKSIAFTNVETDDSKTTKIVRRFVEKRAAQTVFRNSGKRSHGSNHFRQSVRRATSFSLYISTFTEYDQQKRERGTHWKVTLGKYGKKLKSKYSYNSYEEAKEACNNYTTNHPNESRPMTAYKCNHCGKWHIGHDRFRDDNRENMPQVG